MSGVTDNGSDPELKEILSNGQQKKYLVLSDEERAKGFIRPVRRTYIHLKCKTSTRMGQALAETYARDPHFYGGTYCAQCGTHFSLLDEKGNRTFLWEDETGVGE